MLHVVAESSILKIIVETLMTQVEEARFDFYNDRLEVCAVDAANVAMIRMEADAALFDTWDLDECKVVMELAKMREVLTLAAAGEMVEIIFDDFRIVYNDPRRFGFFQIIKTIDNFYLPV